MDNIGRAIRACKHSNAAYANPLRVHRMLDQRIELVSYYDGMRGKRKRDGQAYMLRDGHDLIVAFRGTSLGRDLLDVLDIRHATIVGGGKVHRGFYEQFVSLEPFITRDLTVQSATNIEFVGHSMGGGMAVIAALHYGTNRSWSTDAKNVNVLCHAFGCPRFADAIVNRNVDAHVDHIACFNIVGDPIVRIPIHPDFVRLPNTYELHGDGTLRNDADDHPSSGVFLRHLASDLTFKTHACANYVRQLELVMTNDRRVKS